MQQQEKLKPMQWIFKKNYKNISFFFLFSQGSNLHHQGIPVLWMH